MNTYYLNYRCRKCGQIMYTEFEDEATWLPEIMSHVPHSSGTLMSAKIHKTCIAGLQEDEEAICDLVSISRSPVDKAIKIDENKLV